ncbi:hypothetical protein [Streptomyces sp. NRRL S-87]|uniref:hypothetical protein n=1 Tax=Streptomyces sp. NRRL S-87 TaxID=1463920 RepID=UPI001F26CB21|nr:hypothetical protein [Streptomyces sp. NRRL S-87]
MTSDSGVRPAVRALSGALGLLLIGFGAWNLAAQPDPYAVLVWLAGALVLHDGLLAPLVLAVGLLVAAVPARRAVRGALVTGGALVLITLPLLLRPGAAPNPSALPLPYARNLVLVLAVVAVLTTATARVGLTHRRRRRPQDGRARPVRDRRATTSATGAPPPGAGRRDPRPPAPPGGRGAPARPPEPPAAGGAPPQPPSEGLDPGTPGTRDS